MQANNSYEQNLLQSSWLFLFCFVTVSICRSQRVIIVLLNTPLTPNRNNTLITGGTLSYCRQSGGLIGCLMALQMLRESSSSSSSVFFSFPDDTPQQSLGLALGLVIFMSSFHLFIGLMGSWTLMGAWEPGRRRRAGGRHVRTKRLPKSVRIFFSKHAIWY